MSKLTSVMVEHLNLKLKEEGTALRYVVQSRDIFSISYKLIIEDKYIDNKYTTLPNTTDEFDAMVRNFFKGYGVQSTGFSNHVSILIENIELSK